MTRLIFGKFSERTSVIFEFIWLATFHRALTFTRKNLVSQNSIVFVFFLYFFFKIFLFPKEFRALFHEQNLTLKIFLSLYNFFRAFRVSVLKPFFFKRMKNIHLPEEKIIFLFRKRKYDFECKNLGRRRTFTFSSAKKCCVIWRKVSFHQMLIVDFGTNIRISRPERESVQRQLSRRVRAIVYNNYLGNKNIYQNWCFVWIALLFLVYLDLKSNRNYENFHTFLLFSKQTFLVVVNFCVSSSSTQW